MDVQPRIARKERKAGLHHKTIILDLVVLFLHRRPYVPNGKFDSSKVNERSWLVERKKKKKYRKESLAAKNAGNHQKAQKGSYPGQKD